jgi:anthranilate/para-aminobenzoate synthase component I
MTNGETMIGRVHLHSSLPANLARDWNFKSEQPALNLRCESSTQVTTLRSPTEILQRWTDPLAALDWMANHIKCEPHARWVGYLSYDLGRQFEQIPSIAAPDLDLPLFCFSLHQDPPNRVLKYPEDPDRLQKNPAMQQAPISSLPKPKYFRRVEQALRYINAGDVFQVNLSQRFTAVSALTPAQIWQNLIAPTPAAYGAFLDFGDHAIISNSPELFLQVDSDRRVITRPIKGTRPNQPGMDEQLRNSAKDQAELNMIVDLERNDLGKVCQVGSVKVTQPRTIEAHPTVYHGVATVEGILRDDVTFIDLLRATFPGGSITGAPKIRAMQIIEELEPVRRGPYCGAIGYLAGNGIMQFNVAIRTMIVRDNLVHIQVGGGIVADSDPTNEYEETLVKAQAMLNASGMATGRSA